MPGPAADRRSSMHMVGRWTHTDGSWTPTGARWTRTDASVDEYGNPVEEAFAAEPAGPASGSGGASSARRRRRGLHIGPLAITPTRVTLLIALIGSMAFLAYAVTVRDTSQIPLLASGSAVLGIVFAALALSGATGAVRAGREGSGGRAFAMALTGGLASVIAFGCFGAAIVLALVWRP